MCYSVSDTCFRLCRDRRACPDPLALLARLDQWVRLEKMADPDLLERQARRALPDSLEQQANLACLGLLGRRARWARMVPTACRVPRELWGLTVSRVSLVLRVSWAHRGSQASKARRASTACPVLRERPVSEELQAPTGPAECQEPTAPRELPARVALLVLKAPQARPEPLALPAHMARGMVITTVADCFVWDCRGYHCGFLWAFSGASLCAKVCERDRCNSCCADVLKFHRLIQCAFATCVPSLGTGKFERRSSVKGGNPLSARHMRLLFGLGSGRQGQRFLQFFRLLR